MKFKIGDTVNHPEHGVGLVMQVIGAELYDVYFVTVLRNDGIVRCPSSELTLIEHEEVQK